MMFHCFRRNPRADTIASLYGTIVAHARAATFYQNYGEPDTVNGRFDETEGAQPEGASHASDG